MTQAQFVPGLRNPPLFFFGKQGDNQNAIHHGVGSQIVIILPRQRKPYFVALHKASGGSLGLKFHPRTPSEVSHQNAIHAVVVHFRSHHLITSFRCNGSYVRNRKLLFPKVRVHRFPALRSRTVLYQQRAADGGDDAHALPVRFTDSPGCPPRCCRPSILDADALIESRGKCACRTVVCSWLRPGSLPIIGRLWPTASARKARECRRSCRRTAAASANTRPSRRA